MSHDFKQRFGFLVNEVGRLYSKRFDQLARQRLGLTRAQCRLIGVVARHEAERSLSQAELAQELDLTPMAVTTLCERMEAAGWIRRVASPTDRRAYRIELEASAREALGAAMALSDEVQDDVLAGVSEAQRAQLIDLLGQALGNLQALQGQQLAQVQESEA
jgi:DNA-binding MarR family transcriptional regulator